MILVAASALTEIFIVKVELIFRLKFILDNF